MKKIKINRCSCHCGGRWAYFTVQPHGAETAVGCLCHTDLSNNGPEWTEIELVNSTAELLEIFKTMLWDFNRLSETSRSLFDSLDARLLKVEQKTDTNIMHDDPQHSSFTKVSRDIRGMGEWRQGDPPR